jgi:hypothetical protein
MTTKVYPLCCNCVHFNQNDRNCGRGQKYQKLDLMHGQTYTAYKPYKYAKSQRLSLLPWKCGKRGRFFQPKDAV